jgi:hypothetical protein
MIMRLIMKILKSALVLFFGLTSFAYAELTGMESLIQNPLILDSDLVTSGWGYTCQVPEGM